jgi:Nucleotidyl transferase AbiEii toxin, Type IV TA system
VLARVLEILPPESSFALAGGGALIARGIVERVTDDLDLFTSEQRDVRLAATLVEEGLAESGWTVDTVRAGASFRRYRVTDLTTASETLLDIGWDARIDPPSRTELGPTLTVHELAADKVLALFGRAEARDLVDLHALSAQVGYGDMLAAAREKDAGFDTYVFAQMLARTAARPDADFPIDAQRLAEVREWAHQWRSELAGDLLE